MGERSRKILGVSLDASILEIDRAYRRKARVSHPDKTKNPATAAKFQELCAARAALLAERRDATIRRDVAERSDATTRLDVYERFFNGRPRAPKKKRCQRCRASAAKMFVQPCGHLAYCVRCAETVTHSHSPYVRCPGCAGPITSIELRRMK